MMTERQLIERFLKLQEHPELMNDEQLQQALDDPEMRELVEQVALVKRTFKNEELQERVCDIDEEWRKFAVKHFDEGNATRTDMPSSMSQSVNGDSSQNKNHQLRKIAASFIGLLVVSSIAFAAIQIVRHHGGGDLKSPTQEMRISNPHQQTAPSDTDEPDTTITMAQDAILQPVVFDNVRLDEMLPQIASYYHTEVSFQNETARELRFHFVWKHEDGLKHAIEKLNRFESLSVRLEEGDGEHQSTKIIVE